MCTAKSDVVSLAEAAALLETTEPRILMMLKNNQLIGHQEQGNWSVDKASLALCSKPKPSDFRTAGCGGGCGNGRYGSH